MAKKAREVMFLHNNIVSSTGSRESTRVYLSTSLKDGESELVIEKTYTERYPVTDYDKVMKLYEDLTDGGGRIVPTLKDLAK
jgi:hypothetical protein